MKILLTGKTGQVGYELERSLQGLGEIIALDRNQMNLTNLNQVRDVINQVKPNLIINSAAYTAVDKAESESHLAMIINAEAPSVMAKEAKKIGAAMIHYSTDYVFNGMKGSPYSESDDTCPINAYGRTKLAGEQAIQATGIPHLILRTSWVYGMRRDNFFLKLLHLAENNDELFIVDDQYGAPTWCRTIADTTAHIVSQSRGAQHINDWWSERTGLYHLTAQGLTTWNGFAHAILEKMSVTKKPSIKSITSQEFSLPAKRPKNSALSCELLVKTFCTLPHWESTLRLCQE